MAKITLDDFTKKELIDALCKWMLEGVDCETHICDLVDDIRAGKYIDWYNERLKNEN